MICESGIIHSAGHALRYLDTVRQEKEYLRGRYTHLIQVFRFGGIHPSKWWCQLDMPGGHLVDAVTHQVDLVHFLTGEFQEVGTKFGRLSLEQSNPVSTNYDAESIMFKLEHRTVGSITETCLSPYHSASDISCLALISSSI